MQDQAVYYQKYLKYKAKYLLMKGGANSIIAFYKDNTLVHATIIAFNNIPDAIFNDFYRFVVGEYEYQIANKQFTVRYSQYGKGSVLVDNQELENMRRSIFDLALNYKDGLVAKYIDKSRYPTGYPPQHFAVPNINSYLTRGSDVIQVKLGMFNRK